MASAPVGQAGEVGARARVGRARARARARPEKVSSWRRPTSSGVVGSSTIASTPGRRYARAAERHRARITDAAFGKARISAKIARSRDACPVNCYAWPPQKDAEAKEGADGARAGEGNALERDGRERERESERAETMAPRARRSYCPCAVVAVR